MTMAKEGNRPRWVAAVQAEVGAALRVSSAAGEDRRQLLVTWERSEAKQRWIWCCETKEWILGLTVKFLALRGYVALFVAVDIVDMGFWERRRREGLFLFFALFCSFSGSSCLYPTPSLHV